MKKCIFTACTEDYLNRAISLYNSLNKFNKGIYFSIHLINISKNNYFEKIDNNKLKIEYITTNYKNDELKVYASCIRANIFQKIIKEYDIIFWMDADTIIRDNVEELFNYLNDNDITIFKSKDNIKKIGGYKTGIIGIKKNNRTISFINKWVNTMKDNEFKWFLDQISITLTILNSNDIKIKELPKKYIDWDFNILSPIWVGKGSRKNNQKYLNEELKYNNNNNNIDLYYDRNMNDSIIGSTIKSIEKYFIIKNMIINKEWNKLNKKNNINIQWGIKCIFKSDTNFREILMKNYKYSIIIEQGFINRDIYRSFGINGFAGHSKIKPTNCPNDRFNKLNINVKNMNINKNGYILFCGQLPWDTQVQNIDYNKYINNLFNELKKITKRKIMFRYHPLYKPRGNLIITIPNFVDIDKNQNISDSLKNAYCVISYNSTSLIECIIEGIPIVPLNNLSIVYNLGTNNIKDIENLYIPTREKILQELYNISYMQFTEEEFSNGIAINYIKNLLL